MLMFPLSVRTIRPVAQFAAPGVSHCKIVLVLILFHQREERQVKYSQVHTEVSQSVNASLTSAARYRTSD